MGHFLTLYACYVSIITYFYRILCLSPAKKYPTQDFVISHNGGEIECEQVHGHVELDVTGGTIGYKVFASIKGKPFSIVRKGDGGYIYWDYVGDFMR